VIEYDNDDPEDDETKDYWKDRPQAPGKVSLMTDGVRVEVLDPPGVRTRQKQVMAEDPFPREVPATHRNRKRVKSDPDAEVDDVAKDARGNVVSEGYQLLMSKRPEWAKVRWIDLDGVNNEVRRQYLAHGPLGKWGDLAYDIMARASSGSARAKAIVLKVEDNEFPEPRSVTSICTHHPFPGVAACCILLLCTPYAVRYCSSPRRFRR
jgi:hypothetical protein